MNDKNLKKAIKELNLDRFYQDFLRDDYSYNYMEIIYMLNMNDKVYIGNRQIPKYGEDEYNNTIRVTEKYNYWFNGISGQYKILHVFDNISNSYNGNKLANQPTFNIIKQLIVDKLYVNFNVQQLPDEYDINAMFSKQITEWKRNIRKTFKEYTLKQCRSDLLDILLCIDNNVNKWGNLLILNNRFSLISQDENDVEYLSKYEFDKWDNNKQCLFIIMKEWLAFVTINTLNHANKNNIQFFINKLSCNKFCNETLFNHSKMTKHFKHETAIAIILSLLYCYSSQKQISDTAATFMRWRDTKYIPYFNKYINQ